MKIILLSTKRSLKLTNDWSTVCQVFLFVILLMRSDLGLRSSMCTLQFFLVAHMIYRSFVSTDRTPNFRGWVSQQEFIYMVKLKVNTFPNQHGTTSLNRYQVTSIKFPQHFHTNFLQHIFNANLWLQLKKNTFFLTLIFPLYNYYIDNYYTFRSMIIS